MQLPEYDPAYDPVESLELKKVRIIRHTLSGVNAIWVPERRAVIVDRGLRIDLVRPTLGHEDDHVINNDPGGHHPRLEARANLHSALRMTNPQLWNELAAVSTDYDAMCLEIGLTRRQFRAYHQHQERIAAKELRLERLGLIVYRGARMGAGQWLEKIEVA